MLLNRSKYKFSHINALHGGTLTKKKVQKQIRWTLGLHLQALLRPHLNPSACPARWSSETVLLYKEVESRTVHSTVCCLQQKLLYTGCLWLYQPTAWRETIRWPESVSESLPSLHIWDWFVMAAKYVVQDKDSMDHLTGHWVSMLILTSEPSRLDTNACTDSSSSVPFLISISFRTLWIMGREKGGMVRTTPLEERRTR